MVNYVIIITQMLVLSGVFLFIQSDIRKLATYCGGECKQQRTVIQMVTRLLTVFLIKYMNTSNIILDKQLLSSYHINITLYRKSTIIIFYAK